ncbi:MAG: caspase family protein [Candidatus Electrothrix sp. GW3-4]|uniref:caspase family protein n=1 Tax=Candidatus Electrothrix sp. GW3-4 TaxID=3126740 RepID=UPI0030CEE5B3
MLVRKKTVQILALVLLLLSAPAAQAKKALLIGIEDYPHAAHLRGPVQDVENIEKLIKADWGYRKEDIHKLINSRATRKNILSELKNWLEKSTDQELLLYYSGHGWHQKDTDGDEKDGEDETLAPYDTLPKPAERIVEHMILDDEIAGFVQRLQERKIILIFDSCYSGTVSRGGLPVQLQAQEGGIRYTKSLDPFASSEGTRGLTVTASKALRREGGFIPGNNHVTVWSAASSSQKAFTDLETRSGSFFTNRFIQGVRERKADFNKDGIVTNSEQLMYLRQESEAFCKRNHKICTLGLTPMLEIGKDLYGSSLTGEKKSQLSVQTGVESMLPGEDSGEVSVRVREGRRLRLGDTVTVECRSNKSGYLILLDINAKGEMLQVFPNQYSTPTVDNFIPAHTTVVVPGPDWGFSIEAQLPLGQNTLIAIFTEDRVEMSDLLGMHKDLQVISEPTTYLAEVTRRLQAVWVGDEVNRAVKWSKGVFEYLIEP